MIELKRKTQNKKPKLVGRGSKRGKTSGRGTKGQKSRAGHKIRPEIRDRIKKLPIGELVVIVPLSVPDPSTEVV